MVQCLNVFFTVLKFLEFWRKRAATTLLYFIYVLKRMTVLKNRLPADLQDWKQQQQTHFGKISNFYFTSAYLRKVCLRRKSEARVLYETKHNDFVVCILHLNFLPHQGTIMCNSLNNKTDTAPRVNDDRLLIERFACRDTNR